MKNKADAHFSMERKKDWGEFAQKVHEFKHSRSKAKNSAKTEDLPTALARITDREEKDKAKRKCLVAGECETGLYSFVSNPRRLRSQGLWVNEAILARGGDLTVRIQTHMEPQVISHEYIHHISRNTHRDHIVLTHNDIFMSQSCHFILDKYLKMLIILVSFFYSLP